MHTRWWQRWRDSTAMGTQPRCSTSSHAMEAGGENKPAEHAACNAEHEAIHSRSPTAVLTGGGSLTSQVHCCIACSDRRERVQQPRAAPRNAAVVKHALVQLDDPPACTPSPHQSTAAAVYSIIYSQLLVCNDMRGYTSSWNTRSHPTLTHLTPHPHTHAP
jgi:hypothetical protein